MASRSKYKTRADGRKATTRTYDNFGVAKFSGKKIFYGKTDAEIDRKIAEFERTLTEEKKRCFSSIADEYWRGKQEELSVNSVHGYDVAVRRAKDEFGDTEAAAITPHDIYNYLLKFKAQGYSQKIISNNKSVLREIFDYAFILNEINVNPCDGIPIVKGKPKVPRQAASEEDVRKIEENRTESMTSRLLYFLLYTGARIGEASVLQWADIDMDRKIARVCKTLAYGNSSTPGIKYSPKTEAGFRELQLLDNVIEILPERGADDDFVFFPDGLPRRRAFDTAIIKFKEKHNLQCTPHQLRHSYASMLHDAKVDVKDAQTLLGHSSVAMTQDIYTHLDRQHKENVRNDLNQYIKNQK